MGTKGKLTYKQRKYVKALTEGKDIHSALVTSGLTTSSRDSYGYQLLRKPQVIEALKRAGLTDAKIAESLRQTLDNGVNNSDKTATAGDVIRIAELYYRVNGVLNNTNINEDNRSNIYIKELRVMDTKQLRDKLNSITADII